MQAHPDVLKALSDVHNAEATASEKWHKQEHEFKEGDSKIPKLGEFFDKLHKKAFKRQHKLRNTLIKHGGDVDTKLGDTSYSDDPGEALKSAHATLTDLMAKHQAVNEVTRDAADATKDGAAKAAYRGIREKYHGTACKLHDLCRKVEQKHGQLKAMGSQLFVAKHS